MMAVRMVASRMNALYGPYLKPSQMPSTTVRTSWNPMATSGVRQRESTEEKRCGSNRIRPMANQVRVAAAEAAFWLANSELRMARKAITQNAPHTRCASSTQGPVKPPTETNVENLVGPKYTVAA